MTSLRFLQPLAILPAALVFAWLVGVFPAGGSPPPEPPPLIAPVIHDAWDVPVAKRDAPDPTMLAWSDLPAPVKPKSETDYQQELERRAAMPATKSGIAFVPSSYADHVQAVARKNRLRFTRLWYTRTLDPKTPPDLLAFLSAPAVECAEHTWAFAREFDLSFELSDKGAALGITTDGPPALTECLAKRLTEWRPPARKTKQATAGKIIVSFVVVKV